MKALPPLRALQAFEAFGRLGSVTAAAEELGVSVGAVSQQIRKAEAAAGVRLLERAGRHLSLTARGKQYLDGISEGFDLIRQTQDRIERAKTEGVLTLSCLPSLASKWLGARLFDWQASNPRATVRLVGEDAEPRLGTGQADFRLSYGRKIKGFDHRVELFTDWVLPVCSPEFLTRHPAKSPQDILGLPLLGIEWSSDQGVSPGWVEWAASCGITLKQPSGLVTFSLSSAAIDAAINNRGFVLAQLSMVADDIAAGRLVAPFDARFRLSEAYFLAWDRNALEKPFGPELRAWIIALSKRQDAAPWSSLVALVKG